MSYQANIRALLKQLAPTGRAFKGPRGGWLDTLRRATSLSLTRAYADALKIQDAQLPDNPGFTADDATDWERRLGMIYSPLVSLDLRKAAIRRKMNHPGTIKARQHYLYVQGQLQAAGFNVFVYENRFDDGMGGLITKSPIDLSGGGPGVENAQYNQFQYGQRRYGGKWANVVVNYIEEEFDKRFDVGSNLRSTFFIGGATPGAYAYVPLIRKDEFRQLILKLKPAQMVGYLFIVYV